MDLVTFLLARLDEDEQVARSATSGPWSVRPETRSAHSSLYGEADVDGPDGRAVAYDRDGGCTSTEDAQHIVRHDPARVLADVEAKRRIVEGFQYLAADPDLRQYAWTFALRALTMPYIRHADYQPEWNL